MHVKRFDGLWEVVDNDGSSRAFFKTNAEAWKWIDRNTNEGGHEGDHGAEIERLQTELKAWRDRFPSAGFDGGSVVLSG